MRRARTFLIGALAAISLAGAPAASAGSRVDAMRDTITAVKARDHLAIERRLAVLDALTRRIDTSAHLTASHRSTLAAQYATARSGLRALDAAIQADTALAEVRADQVKIVSRYRVYVLVVPKTHIVIAADRIAFIASALTSLESKLEAAANKAPAGSDTDAAMAALADMAKQIKAATGAVSGVADSVLALEASGYPANRSILLSARADLVTARTALRAARAEAATAIAKLA